MLPARFFWWTVSTSVPCTTKRSNSPVRLDFRHSCLINMLRSQRYLFFLSSLFAFLNQPSCAFAFSVDVLSLTTNLGAAISAGAEVFEDIEHVGHGHGMLLLTGSRLCREMNVLRESVADGSKELGSTPSVKQVVKRPLALFVRLVTNPTFVRLLSIGALLAAWVEVVEDCRPGGHHGSVLLALNELIELREEAGTPALIPFLRRASVRLAIVSGAVIMALWETVTAEVSKKSLGAHHSVLFLGIARILRCVGLARKDRNEIQKKAQ